MAKKIVRRAQEPTSAAVPGPDNIPEVTHVAVRESAEHRQAADGILRIFANYPSLYIDAGGRVFTLDSDPIVRGDAILYTNPYYHNSKD